MRWCPTSRSIEVWSFALGRSWVNQTEVTVPGSHFIQEDSGPAIGRAVAGWMKAASLWR